MLNQFINSNEVFEPIQQNEIDRLNEAIRLGKVTKEDEVIMKRKYFNPQTGELTFLVGNNTNDGIRLASVNLFE